MRRRTTFATPFVITTACWSSPAPPVEEPRPEPTRRPDTRMEVEPTELVEEPAPVIPPVAPDGALVVQPRAGGPCYLVYERKMRGRTSRTYFDEGQVDCPPGGPNVKLPAKTYVTVNATRYRLNEESLTCSSEVLGNPPGWQASPCPAQLLPEAVGITPDANCVYRGVTVWAPNCRPNIVPGTVARARIIGATAVANGTEVTVGAGKAQGMKVGATLRIDSVGSATITACTNNMCRAIFVAVTPAQIAAAATHAVVED